MQGYTRGDIFPIQMKINCSQCVSTQKRSVTTCHQQEIIQLHQLDFHQDASQHFYQQKDSRLCPKTSILSVIKVCCKGADKQRKDTPGVSQTPTEEANRRWSTTLFLQSQATMPRSTQQWSPGSFTSQGTVDS